MPELWDATFQRSRLIWGANPTASALFAADYLAFVGAEEVLIPGIGYGRNAKPFLERGMRVTGIETSGAAIALARTHLDLDITIHHGSALDMPFDDRRYDAVFCHILISLLDSAGRAALLRKCISQLAPGGTMIFTVISKAFEMYGRGQKLGEDWYEVQPGARMYFYDADSLRREFGGFGAVDFSDINQPLLRGEARPFRNVICRPEPAQTT